MKTDWIAGLLGPWSAELALGAIRAAGCETK